MILKMLVGAVVVFGVFIAATMLFLGGLCSEAVKSKYSTLADAEGHGEISRGWLPSILPKSTFDIRETHDLDTNECEFSFRYDPKESPVFLRALNKAGERSYWYREAETGVIFHFDVDTTAGLAKGRHGR